MPFPPDRPYNYVRDEDGELRPEKDFVSYLTHYCNYCEEILGDYVPIEYAFCPPPAQCRERFNEDLDCEKELREGEE